MGVSAAFTQSSYTLGQTIRCNVVWYPPNVLCGGWRVHYKLYKSGETTPCGGAEYYDTGTTCTTCYLECTPTTTGTYYGFIEMWDLAGCSHLVSDTASCTVVALTTYHLTRSYTGSGSIYTCTSVPSQPCPPCDYTSGTVVTLYPQPAAGWHFDSWDGDLTGGANPGVITMNGNKSITANYVINTTGPNPQITSVTASPSTIYHPGQTGGSTTITANGKNNGGQSGDFLMSVSSQNNGNPWNNCGTVTLASDATTSCPKTRTVNIPTGPPYGTVQFEAEFDCNNAECQNDYVLATTDVSVYYTLGVLDDGLSTFYPGPFSPGTNVHITNIRIGNAGNYNGNIYIKYFYQDTGPTPTWIPITTITQTIAGGSPVNPTYMTFDHYIDLPSGMPTGSILFGVKVWGQDQDEPAWGLGLSHIWGQGENGLGVDENIISVIAGAGAAGLLGLLLWKGSG